MSFLRLSTSCAVFDDQERVLLSLRGDLNHWNLPGGRLDAHEWLPDAAAREVREETGVEVEIERAVGLFYWQGWDRLNVLYRATPVGGQLTQRTFETRRNGFFAVDQLPGMLDAALVHAALIPRKIGPQMRITSPEELRRVRWALRRRYVTNLLRGKPEPRHVRFDTQAVGIIFDLSDQQILVGSHADSDSLPSVTCDGAAPWIQLARRIDPTAILGFEWVGLWQQPSANRVQFVFLCSIAQSEKLGTTSGFRWKPIADATLNARDRAYLTQTTRSDSSADQPVWMIQD